MKKIIIIILLIIAICVPIFNAELASQLVQRVGIENSGTFWGYAMTFYVLSTVLLFWIGLAAGWNFSADRDWPSWVSLICAIIGLYLSLPIALIQLFIPKR